jgi:mRNA interferase MazF
MVTTLSRGDVIIVELDPTRGSEQRSRRPCLVVQNDVGNENAPTTIIVPFTTSFGDRLYPFEVLVPADECALKEDSVALCSQIHTVSIHDGSGTVSGRFLTSGSRRSIGHSSTVSVFVTRPDRGPPPVQHTGRKPRWQPVR